MSVIEIRTYQLHPGQRIAFHDLVRNGSVPLLEKAGIEVVTFQPSQHDENSYVLIRRFASLLDRETQEGLFYGSRIWLSTYEERIMKMIHSYLTVVIDANNGSREIWPR